MRELIFIGRRFYRESGTRMTSLYEIREGDAIRVTLGELENILDSGEEVHIRLANGREMREAYEELARIQSESV